MNELSKSEACNTFCKSSMKQFNDSLRIILDKRLEYQTTVEKLYNIFVPAIEEDETLKANQTT